MRRKNVNQNQLYRNEIIKTARIFFYSSIILLASGLKFDNGIEYILAPGQLLLYFILGFLNAFIDYRYYIRNRMELLTIMDSNSTGRTGLFQFIWTIFLYTGLYQTIMLPAGGLLILEMLAMAGLLGVVILGFKIGKEKYQIHPKMIFIFQALLLLIKVASWFMPENIYISLFDGNSLGRNLVLVALFLLAYFAVVHKKGPAREEKAKKTFTGILNFFVKIFRVILSLCLKFINFLINVALSPVIIIIIAAVFIILIPALGIGFLETAREELLKIIESILRAGLSSGKYQAQPTFFYCLARIAAIIVYIIYVWEISSPFEENTARELLLSYNKNCDKISEIQSEKNKLLLTENDKILKYGNMADRIYDMVD